MASSPDADVRAPDAGMPLVWISSYREPSGYADEARSVLLALASAGARPCAREFVWADSDAGASARQLAAVDAALARPLPDEYVAVHHYVPRPGQPVAACGSDVARTMFETDSIPPHWATRLVELDEVWVPTEFNVETFARGGVPESSMRVLPMTLDFELFTPGAEPYPLEGTRGFTFLANFDFTDRKAWNVLLDAWADAFAPDDDVCLVLKCVSLHGLAPASIRERIDGHLAGRATAPLVVTTDVLPAADLPRLYAAADAYVLASRGEGWGRPYMEAMAMGLPTIASRWSGNLAFMSDTNSWLVDGSVVPVPDAAQAHTPLYRGQRWFEPDRDALAAAMRDVARGGPEVAARAARGAASVREEFPEAAVAAAIGDLVDEALERARWRRSRPVTCAWRGEWGSIHSLAVVNDGVVTALEAAGGVVQRRAPSHDPVRLSTVGVAQHWPPRFEAPALGPFVLYQPWEFGEIPAAWVEPIRSRVDEVWTPSEYARQAFVAAGIAPALVHVVPNAVDLDRFSPAGEPYPLSARAGTVFLFVGGTTYRKGIDVLLTAYARAFGADDDVLLVVKGFGSDSLYRGQTAEAALAEFRERAEAPALLPLDVDLRHDELPALYRAADCVVQPYRGEGFCLPALEALACGKPVIVTAGGPTDEFVSPDCAWRVPSQRVPCRPAMFQEGLRPAGGGFLLEPDVDALVAALREAADPARRAAKAATARAHAERCSWPAAAAAARSRLDALAGTTPVRALAPQRLQGAQPLLLLGLGDWRAALDAYADAFAADAAVTLALPGATEEEALRVLGGRDDIADVALVPPLPDPTPLVLGADALVGAEHPRARRSVPADPAALRALLAA